ncbi:MAG: GIY-YIG nuclease family protein [Gammaproteobacteria bacterium]|nr:GIY-YIG nuclease family protein [Gammaproteobacteria bacterium]
MQPAVYIMANRRDGTLYTGVTSNLSARVWQHKNNINQGFTAKYGIHLLVYVEFYDDMYAAITREKRIKGWKRKWKLALIEKQNPEWRDLYDDIML